MASQHAQGPSIAATGDCQPSTAGGDQPSTAGDDLIPPNCYIVGAEGMRSYSTYLQVYEDLMTALRRRLKPQPDDSSEAVALKLDTISRLQEAERAWDEAQAGLYNGVSNVLVNGVNVVVRSRVVRSRSRSRRREAGISSHGVRLSQAGISSCGALSL